MLNKGEPLACRFFHFSLQEENPSAKMGKILEVTERVLSLLDMVVFYRKEEKEENAMHLPGEES